MMWPAPRVRSRRIALLRDSFMRCFPPGKRKVCTARGAIIRAMSGPRARFRSGYWQALGKEHPMARRALWFTLLAIPAMTLAAPAGYVLSLEGEWAIEGGPALVVGAEVAPGARLRVKDPHPFAAVQVVDAK